MKKIFKIVMVLLFIFFTTSCGLGTTPHQHEYVDGKCSCGEVDKDYVHEHSGGDLKFDDDSHYKLCSCGEKYDEEEHTLETTFELIENDMNILSSCTECEYTKSVSFDKEHDHEFSEEVKFNETHHYYDCLIEGCEHYYNELDLIETYPSYEEHTFDSGEVLEEATEELGGLVKYTCLECGYTKEVTTEKLPHTHVKVNSSYNSEYHWDLCACNSKFNIDNHSMGEWITDNYPTEESTGHRYKKCNGCEYFIEEELDKLVHVHLAIDEWHNNQVKHWHECRCGIVMDENDHQFDEGKVTINPTPTTKGEFTYTCTICQFTKTELLDEVEVNYLTINAYNTQGETTNFGPNQGIELFKSGVSIGSSLYWHKVLLVKVGNAYQVSDVINAGESITGTYDYILLSYQNDTTGSYDKLVYYLNIGDYVSFSKDINTLENGSVNLTLFKTESVDEFVVNYDLGYDQYDTKMDLYNAFFSEYYYFLLNNTTCDLTGLGIDNVNEFLEVCFNWNAFGSSSFYGIGNNFGPYFLTIDVGGTLEEQPTSTFIGYCYQNNKFKDLIEHLEVFFAYWRFDEGYTTETNNGSDFFASAWAAIVDTCKFFYFTSENITDTYSWFTKQKSPRVHYMLDNIPGVGEVNLIEKSNTTIMLPELELLTYNFLGWFDEAGNEVTMVNSSMNVYAKWQRRVHTVTYNTGGHVETYTVSEGRRSPFPTFKISGYEISDYLTFNGESVDIWNAVYEDLDLYIEWTALSGEIGTVNICGYNTHTTVGSITTYNGLRLYQSGTSIDSSLYWLKVAIDYVGGEYIVTSVVPSGKATPTDYDYLLLVYSGDNTNTYQTMVSMGIQVGAVCTFSKKISSLSKGEVDVNVTFEMKRSGYNLYLEANGAQPFTYAPVVEKGHSVTLPTPIKSGYNFIGWFDNPACVGEVFTTFTPYMDIRLYAKWEEKVIDDALDYISDVVTSNTIDQLPEYFNGSKITYSSSDNELYTIDNYLGYTNRSAQTHQAQTVTVYATLSNGTVYSKEIRIDPVLYDDMEHPKAVYFSVGSANSYKNYSERYKAEGTIFSNKFKENMDMLYYAFAIPQTDGTLTLNTTYIEEVMELKNHGIRVNLVIDGANSAPLKAMVKLCDDPATRKIFVSNIIKLVTTYNFDGVDVDWEFPGVLSSQAGFEKYTTAVDIQNLNSLLKELREAFNELQDANGSNYILSVATPPTYWGTDRFDYQTINKYCDYVNMMSYDLQKSSTASHVTHVYQPSNNYSYKFCCEYGINYYTSLGLDKSKIILGCAAYGKAYKLTGTVTNSSLPGLGVTGTLGQVTGYDLPGQSITWNSGTIYYTGIQMLMESGNFVQYNEYNDSGKLVGSYLYSAKDKYFITFDSVLSVTEKCKLAESNPGMGIMVWAYGEDATDTIINTICDNLK